MPDVLETLSILFESSPGAWVATIFVLGLFVGSFLNVVIHRLPIMMQRAWKAELDAHLAEQQGTQQLVQEPPAAPRYNLVVPRSACPKCGTMITASQNIPIVSYLLLKGRCAKCSAPISVRYPIVEAITAVLSALV